MKTTIKYVLYIIGLLYVIQFLNECNNIINDLYYTKDMLECILYEFLIRVPYILMLVVTYASYQFYLEFKEYKQTKTEKGVY